MPEWFDYREWNTARFAVLYAVLGRDWWAGKRVAVIGSGDAMMARSIQQCGACVTAADAREEYVQDALQGRDPVHAAVVADFDKPWTLGSFDCIVHFGLLYHLADPARSLRDVVTRAPYVLLETHVEPGNADVLYLTEEDARRHDQAVNGMGSRFSAAWVEATLLRLHCGWARLVDERLNVRGLLVHGSTRGTERARHVGDLDGGEVSVRNLAVARVYNQNRREALRLAELCQWCGEHPLVTKQFCAGCRQLRNEWTRARLAERRAAGKCLNCGKEAALAGIKQCRQCRAKYIEAGRKRKSELLSRGLCVTCKQPRESTRSALTTCETCAAKMAAHVARKWETWKQAGLCMMCGKEPSRPGQALGWHCTKRQRRGMRRWKYGIEPEVFNRMLVQQQHRCAICGLELNEGSVDRRLQPCIDHCHRTGAVRGILHRNCNLGLGCFDDKPALLKNALAYLERYGVGE